MVVNAIGQVIVHLTLETHHMNLKAQLGEGICQSQYEPLGTATLQGEYGQNDDFVGVW